MERKDRLAEINLGFVIDKVVVEDIRDSDEQIRSRLNSVIEVSYGAFISRKDEYLSWIRAEVEKQIEKYLGRHVSLQ